MGLIDLKEKGLAPEWMDEAGFQTLSNGYFSENETPYDMFKRVARSAANHSKLELESVYFEMLWKGWLGAASPVLSNLGLDRGLPISCFSIHCEDSVSSIFKKQHELAMLSKHGGGVGNYLGDIRARGATIKGNGKSEGIIPWAKCFDSATLAVSQGSTRRGASALYLPFSHGDIDEFIDLRQPTGDTNRRTKELHHGVCISDNEMKGVLAGDQELRTRWQKLLQTRFELGEPYIFFTDNVNNNNPECYKKLGLTVKTSNICTEILGYTDPKHTFVCCLSSLNLAKFDEFYNHRFSNGMSVPEAATWFLDAILTEFIKKAKNIEGFESAIRFAEKSRMLGLGAMGWHTLLQSKFITFDSFEAMMLNNKVFSFIDSESKKASRNMATEFGEPEWCKGFGIRHTHTIALAPTASNSLISGGIAPSIEPLTANYFAQKTAKGVFMKKNPSLESLLESKGKNNIETWEEINKSLGSVQGLKFLTSEEKELFKTAREINQFAIINQAAQRQKYIDQSQSLNLFFTAGTSVKYFNDVHIHAWQSGIKTLYYVRSESGLKGSEVNYTKDDCKACEG